MWGLYAGIESRRAPSRQTSYGAHRAMTSLLEVALLDPLSPSLASYRHCGRRERLPHVLG